MSFGILVGRFADMVRLQPLPDVPAPPPKTFPENLAQVREVCGHHIVLLMLLAQADGERHAAEIQQILRHCVERARHAGTVLDAGEEASLGAYLESFRAARTQLDPALRRLERDTKEDFSALIATAQRLIEADGVQRQEEIRLLETMRRDLAAA